MCWSLIAIDGTIHLLARYNELCRSTSDYEMAVHEAVSEVATPLIVSSLALSLGFGILLWWMDQRGGIEKSDAGWTLGDAVKLGLWQAIALIPGTSRSGITITGARALGYDRESAARLAMLMSIPAILASGGYLLLETGSDWTADKIRDCAIAAALAFVSALLALKLMMRLLQSVSFTPYVIYRVILGLILLVLTYS